ncbi:MAG: threonine--tRNA ligase [Coxiellaceae bacterium]|jgi:threonyl-tRNA synthetase|nr:threonine--tRNA ligase [Coxiellaceae bacterium]
MLNVTFPNGKKIEFKAPVTILKVAETISPKSAKDAIAGKVNGKQVDLSYLIDKDAVVTILTPQDSEGLEILRHSAAHLLAQAVTELFPSVQVTVGPAIEDGFYHDFYYPEGFTEEDLEKIEAKMHELAKANYPVIRSVKKHDDAVKFFADRGENYKVMMIEDIPDDTISFYAQGNFINACLGPHVPSTGYLKAFKLTKLSGAYWKGDSHNEMLQRIYGIIWATEKELREYLDKLEQAKLRDHRIIGKKMHLFHLQEEAAGLIFWHPKGWIIYSEIKRYVVAKVAKAGYQEVNTPSILDRSLWEKSGHWDKYREVMFTTESEKRIYALKPMNCPGHVQIFKQGIKSYRDLPIRFAEFGCCHRNEASGSLHGIMRIRGFTQDDGHIFCTEEQIANEAYTYIGQVINVYADFGFKNIIVKLATRPKERIGSDAVWDKAEKALIEVLDQTNISWEVAPGDGAFYGPKIEFSLRDCLGRIWQCGTLQVDFSMPERLGAYYITESGEKKSPVMLHRAMLGSIERFISILLEETNGDLPLWLTPIQAVMVNITDAQAEYVKNITQKLQQQGYRVVYDLRNEKVGFKIREHSIAKIPFILIIGNKEMTDGTISVRTSNGKDLGQMSVEKVMTNVMIINPIERTKGGIYQFT